MDAKHSRHFLNISAAVTALTVGLGLSGCSMGNVQLSGATPSGAAQAATLSGTVHGGQYPVYGATLQLYAAGTPAAPTGSNPIVGGLGQGATALIATGSMTVSSTNNYYPGGASGCTFVTGNTNNCTALPSTTTGGGFTISGDYSCSGSTELYLVATGGDPTGANSSTIHNQYLAMMAALGPCSGINMNTGIILNEVTTVGAVYALNQFMAAPSGTAASAYASQGGATTGIAVNVGASSGPVGGYGTDAVQTQQVGLVNAFKMVNNISDYTQGSANPIAANTWATPYSAMTYTIADILAYCINTNPAVSSTNCTNLMTKTTIGGYTPADTIQAAWSMARYPVNNVSTLYSYVAGTGNPFTGDLGSTPTTFVIELGLAPLVPGGNSLNAAGNAVSNASAGAFDEYGHLWLENMNASSTSATATAPVNKVFVTEIDSTGAFLNGPYNAYTAHGGYQVSSADPCASGYTHNLAYNGSSVAEALAVDLTNTVWVTNGYEYTTSTGGIAGGNCSSNYANALMRITGSTSSGTGAAVTTGYYVDATGAGSPTSLAIDANDNVWTPATGTAYNIFPAAGSTDNATTSLYPASSPASSDSSTIIDGLGNAWTAATFVCTGGAGIVYESPASSTGASPTLTAGYYYNGATGCPTAAADGGTVTVNAASTLGEAAGLAADKNNGIWVANYKTQGATGGGTTLTYFLPSSSSWITAGTVATPGGPIPAAAALNSTSGYGVATPYFLAVDGSNNVWVANSGSNKVGEFSVTLSGGNISSIQSVPAGASGYNFPYFSTNPFFEGSKWVGIDPSGNVWFLSETGGNASTTQTNFVTVLVGAATPVITPLALQIAAGRVGQAPQ